MLNRRSFLSSSFASSLAVGARPGLARKSMGAARIPADEASERSLFDQNEDTYWRELRKQFLIPPDEIYLNNGTWDRAPRPCCARSLEGYEKCEATQRTDPEDYSHLGYASWNQFVNPLASVCKADNQRRDSRLLRNATEANSYIANGVDLKPGAKC